MVKKINIADAIIKVVQSVLWGAISSLICQCTLDRDTTGAFIWDYVANDVLSLNDTAAREKAENIERGLIFSRVMFATFGLSFGITFFAIYFEVAKLFQNESMDEIRDQEVRSSLRFTDRLAHAGSVFV